MFRKLIIAGVLVMTLLSGVCLQEANAQSTAPDVDRGGSAGSSWLLLPPTARSAALGASATGGVVTMNGLEASFENPAALILSDGTSALFSRMNYVADIGVNTFGFAQRLGANSIGLTVMAWDFGDIPETTEDNPDVTEFSPTWSATYLSVGATYARQFTDRISAGAAAKLVSESMASDLNARSFAFDAGMTYTVGETGLRFGVSLKNFGPAMKYGGDGLIRNVSYEGAAGQRAAAIEAEEFELPSLLNFGVSYRNEVAAGAVLTLLGNFRSNSYDDDQFSGGLELGLYDVFYVRGGYQWQNNIDDTFFDGWNLGAGLNLNVAGTRFQFDYAYRPTIFDAVQMFTASVNL